MNTLATAEDVLSSIRRQTQKLWQQPGLGSVALGLPQYDRQLWRLGQGRIETVRSFRVGGTSGNKYGGPHVFLATELYQDGGHTALIGDFLSALTATGERSSAPHLVLTNISGCHGERLADRIRRRTGVLPDNVHILPGPSLEERLDQLTATLLDLQPRGLFLFHHPDDPLGSVVAQPAISRQCFLVHHADAIPTLGLHLPGVRVIELNPIAAANARMRRLSADLLLLTAPDPGPRPCDFLGRGRLVTATCGSAHKYESEYVYSYADAVAVILQTTGGWHIHIGPLGADALARISAALDGARVKTERFVHLPWVPSLPEALWEHRCDVYFASFPIDGARAYVEVAASATPYLAHGSQRSRAIDSWAIGPKSAAVWNTLDELAYALQRMSDRRTLVESARIIRRSYDAYHHPDVFRRTLHSIVAGEGGFVDPDEPARDQLALRSGVGVLENVLTVREGIIDQRLDRISAEAQADTLERRAAVERLENTVQSLNVSLERNIATSEELKRCVEQIEARVSVLQNVSTAREGFIDQRLDRISASARANTLERRAAVERLENTVQSLNVSLEQNIATSEELKQRVEQIEAGVGVLENVLTARAGVIDQRLDRISAEARADTLERRAAVEWLENTVHSMNVSLERNIAASEQLKRRVEQIEATRYRLRRVWKKLINTLRRDRTLCQIMPRETAQAREE